MCYLWAITSTSQRTFFGNSLAAIQDLAGQVPVKNSLYTLLKVAKSDISAIKHVVLITSSNEKSASSSTAFTLFKDCLAWSSILSETTSPVSGFTGIWPETYANSPATIPCEYGPIAAGAFFVFISLLILSLLSIMKYFSHL